MNFKRFTYVTQTGLSIQTVTPVGNENLITDKNQMWKIRKFARGPVSFIFREDFHIYLGKTAVLNSVI